MPSAPTAKDARITEEFRKANIHGAVNIPLDILENCESIPQNGVIVYCSSGMRSLDAVQRLRKMGYSNVLNFGSMDRWG